MPRKSAKSKKAQEVKQSKLLEAVKGLENAISELKTELKATKEKELNAKIACELLRLYFEEIARTGLKRQLTLAEIVNAYKFTLERLEGKLIAEQGKKEPEPISTLKEIKEAIEKPKEKKGIK
jgi:septal ring factor EnvC (AmiA/AmiB activator)